MKIIEKFKAKTLDPMGAEPVTIAFLGDSVTQGCFEIYKNGEKSIETVFDIRHAYHTYIRDMMCSFYPNVPLNIINAGISGDNAVHGLERIERDVLRFSPDLTVVAFGLNDSTKGEENLANYKNALKGICKKLKEAGSEVIILTTNMMMSKPDHTCTDETIKDIGARTRAVQCGGVLDKFMDAARAVSAEEEVKLCDCYKLWKTLYESGAHTDLLLANRINHPIRGMNKMFANEIVKVMFE